MCFVYVASFTGSAIALIATGDGLILYAFLICQAYVALDKMGRRMAELEADVAFFGMCLRKKYVDPLFFKQLAASGIPWKDKRKVIKAY
ncbi:hypothetical protein HPB47_004565, partial [Ixodes persulcatus]